MSDQHSLAGHSHHHLGSSSLKLSSSSSPSSSSLATGGSGSSGSLSGYSAAGSITRRMRNTAVLVKWIEDHQSNPYPTKAEKQYLAYYSGMNMTQLSTWFANARRRIKKIGMKTWLEGRSTFSLDYFPTPRASSIGSLDSFTAGSYHGLSSSPYASAAAATYGALTNGLHSSYPSQQNTLLSGGSGMTSHLTNGLGGTSYDSSTLQPTSSTTPPLSGFYGTRSMSLGMPALPVGQWPSTPILSSPPVSFHSRPSSGNTAPLHSPLTAQVYSADTSLRTHSAQSIDVGDSSYSSLQQHSPDQMLPECASTEPMLSDHKSGVTLQN
ncbi:PREDICTED: BEL1-like homeodomain protein 9 [Amphimedon queenslandica]|uniref:Homeobox domain-containing protein n=1 Tax=Amphimedon queenslandica TaxID=400682 RepID=A0A1X7VF08_AMPQE|nr:PREDICTED: BEL1-like homeodomain protein 9 [Amphimedon queenslandica]|eukprot:XP_011410489.1 PREDICTED: BEL1-like homeodomain protein 9 [Amphimedon queenslandica]